MEGKALLYILAGGKRKKEPSSIGTDYFPQKKKGEVEKVFYIWEGRTSSFPIGGVTEENNLFISGGKKKRAQRKRAEDASPSKDLRKKGNSYS